jgi:hypothetical protein
MIGINLDRTDWIALLLAAVVVLSLVLMPPVIGVADNGDFPKIMGRFSLVPAAEKSDWFYKYAHTKYIEDPKSYWNLGFLSSEAALAIVAVRTGQFWAGDHSFDIRFLGILHAALFLAAFWLALPLLRPLPPWRRRALIGLVILFFADVMYVQFYNSFFMDTAAFLFLLLAVVFLLRARYLPFSKLPDGLFFLISSSLFLLAKAQHAPLCIALVLFACSPPLLLWPSRRLLSRSVATISLAGCALFAFFYVPKGYADAPLFTVIFTSILPAAENPSAELRELGLDDSFLKYRGMQAYDAGSPMKDWNWGYKFVERATYPKLARFYLRHPGRAAQGLIIGLNEASYQRPEYLGNFDKAAGYPPNARSERFAFWSGLKRAIFTDRGLAYLLYFVCLLLILARFRPADSIGLGLMASLALAVGALADAADTTRHLFLFNCILDLTAIGAIASLLAGPSKGTNQLVNTNATSGYRPGDLRL